MINIRTERLELMEYKESDMEEIVEKINDETITRYTLNIPHPYKEKDFLDFLEMIRKEKENGSSLTLCLHLREDGSAIGGIGLHKIESNNETAEIGYWISKEHRGKGLVTEAVKALISYGFTEMGLHRIQAVIFEPNDISKKVLERVGFTYEGRIRERYLKDGRRYDGLMFSIISTDPNI